MPATSLVRPDVRRPLVRAGLVAVTCLALLAACGGGEGLAVTDNVSVDVSGSGTGSGSVAESEPDVSINCSITSGTAATTGCTDSFYDAGAGGSFDLTAAAAAGSSFSSWTGCTSSSGTTCTLTFAAAQGGGAFNVIAAFALDAAPACNNPAPTLQDDFAVGTQWTTSEYLTDGTFSHTETQLATGGNPAGYRRMSHTVGPPGGTSTASYVWVAHFYTGGTYTPSAGGAAGGAISKVIYSEDHIAFTSFDIGWDFAVRQGGQTYVYVLPGSGGTFNNTSWVATGPYEIAAADFGTTAPDFSAAGGMIEFGYVRHNSTVFNPTTAYTTEHGIDNWKVQICR